MAQPFLRLLIQERLADGHLPRAPIPRMWGGPGHGETCDGCGENVTSARMVMENLDDAAGGGVQLHVACFRVWDVEHQVPGREPSVRLPARSGFRAPAARPGRPRAPSAPAARPASASP